MLMGSLESTEATGKAGEKAELLITTKKRERTQASIHNFDDDGIVMGCTIPTPALKASHVLL
jgi:hypothetical protein